MLSAGLFVCLLAAILALIGFAWHQRRQLLALKKTVDKLNNALDHVPAYIYTKDNNQRYTYGNKATLDLFGVTAEEIVGQRDNRFFPPETVARLAKVDSNLLRTGEASHEEIVAGTDPDTQKVYWEVKHPLRDSNGKTIGLVGISTDMTEVYRLRQEMERIASTDELTALNNRRSFFELAGSEFARSRRYKLPLSFLVMDIDHFKRINDAHGHPFGDKVLQAFAKNCKRSIRACDFIGRIGGEEFAVLLPRATTEEAMEVAERIRREDTTVTVGNGRDHTVTVTTSIGLASLIDSDNSISDVYSRADSALYQAKQEGRNRVVTCGQNGGASPEP